MVHIRSAYPTEAQAVYQSLMAFNASTIGPCTPKPLQLIAIDDGRMVAGFIGQTVVGWLNVDAVWVSEERRRQGLGRSLMNAAEAEAPQRGCRGAFLDTFDWQAEGFYQRLGYRVDWPARGLSLSGSLAHLHE